MLALGLDTWIDEQTADHRSPAGPSLRCQHLGRAGRGSQAPCRCRASADFTQLDSIEAMARSALALADGPLVAVGHSMGARVALEMVRLAPERIEGSVLIDTGIDPRREGEEAKRQELVDLAFAEGMGALADRWLPPMVHVDRVGDAALHGSAEGDGHAGNARAAPAPDQGAPRSPGRPDRACDNRLSDPGHGRAAGSLEPSRPARGDGGADPGATLVVIEDSGHMSPVEQPEQVSQALLRWLGFEDKHDAADGARQGSEKPMGDETEPDRIPGHAVVRPQALAARLSHQQDGHGARRPGQPGGVPAGRERLSRPLRPHVGGKASRDDARLAARWCASAETSSSSSRSRPSIRCASRRSARIRRAWTTTSFLRDRLGKK